MVNICIKTTCRHFLLALFALWYITTTSSVADPRHFRADPDPRKRCGSGSATLTTRAPGTHLAEKMTPGTGHHVRLEAVVTETDLTLQQQVSRASFLHMSKMGY